MDHALFSLPVIVSTVTGGDGFDGGGASVCPGNAGFGFLGTSPAKRFAWAWAYVDNADAAKIVKSTSVFITAIL
jgi:hypothetical protein